MRRHLVNELINLLKIDCQQPIAAQYFGLYADPGDPSDIGKNAARPLSMSRSTVHGGWVR